MCCVPALVTSRRTAVAGRMLCRPAQHLLRRSLLLPTYMARLGIALFVVCQLVMGLQVPTNDDGFMIRPPWE